MEEISQPTTENNLSEPHVAEAVKLPKVGRIYSVKRLDGEYFNAEVLEKRELKGKPVEYFVHFENCNDKLLTISKSFKSKFFLIKFKSISD